MSTGIVTSVIIGKRCSKHFSYDCEDMKCIETELFKARNPTWTGVTGHQGAPLTSWALPWLREIEVQAMTRNRQARIVELEQRKHKLMAALGMGVVSPVAPDLIPAQASSGPTLVAV